MDAERSPQLRTVADSEVAAEPGAAPLQPAFDVNPLAELVADVIEATGLLPADKLAFVRERARSGSFAAALVEEGLAEGASVARTLATRHNMEVVDIVEAESSRGRRADPAARPRADQGDPVCDRGRQAADRGRRPEERARDR